jgi:L-2-hydroxyglutarate oxidase LhgO
LIAATDASEVPILEKLFARGLRNGANGIRLIDKADIGRIEPDVSALAAIHSPGTGVLDTHSLMKHLFNEARSAGAMFLYGAEASSIEKDKNGFMVGIKPEGAKVRVRVVINSAGLMSDRVAELAGIDIDRAGYRLKYCKGSYFYYSKASPVNTLIYPVPHEGSAGLGIHATLDVAGRLRLGPDAEYMGSIDYNVDAGKAELFYEKASRMITRIEKNALVPDQAGVRPKLYGPNEKVRDFVITEEGDKGLDGLINLIGIESPGFTASPAIAAMVEKLVKGVLN